MDISFTPSLEVATILNAILDKFENRIKRNPALNKAKGTHQTLLATEHSPRSIKISLTHLLLPTYFSQTDPDPRLIANKQLQELAKYNLIILTWLPGETNHILQSISLANGPRSAQHEALYVLLNRTPLSNHRRHLESLLLAEKFRFEKDDWRARALDYVLDKLHTGKSPAPFSLTDSGFNHDLLAAISALSNLQAETPYRVFSVRVFNHTKRFDDLKPALTHLTRRVNREWKSLSSEDLLRELNLVANPGYLHLAGNWELTDINGQVISLDSFTPSIGFPASQVTSLQKITIRAEWVLCIENLTSFHEFLRANGTRSTQHDARYIPPATLCLMGNPAPGIRHLLRLIPEETPIHLWSDMDYGGFNILSQLRKQVNPRVQPYLMDIATFENYAHLSRPLTQVDTHNLKRLALNPTLKDIHPTIEHILKCGLKLEQEAIEI